MKKNQHRRHRRIPQFLRIASTAFTKHYVRAPEKWPAVARLVPDSEKVCLGRDLAEALTKTTLSAKEAKAWCRDSKAAHEILKAPTDGWR